MVRNGKNRKNENYYIYYLKYSFPGGYRGNAYEKIFLNIHFKKDITISTNDEENNSEVKFQFPTLK
jgi:hypothetical protein